MRKHNFIFFLMFGTLIVNGQQRPHYTQYIMNNYIVNPAIGGIENYIDVKMSIRNQWIGIDGAPKTSYFTIHGPISKQDYRTTSTSFDTKGMNPRGQSYWQDYTSAAPHHGLGMTLVNYSTGYISRLTGFATYSYHVGISNNTSLAAGFGLGLSSINLKFDKIKLANSSDPAVKTAIDKLNSLKPELNAGLWLYSNLYFLGLSAQQIIPVKFSLVDSTLYKSTLIPHLFGTFGLRVPISEDINGLPSIMVRYIASSPVAVDINFKAQYRDLLWIGASYRRGVGFSAMSGVNIANKLNISYSYDVNNSKYMISSMNKGTHEIIIGFLLNNVYGDLCPKNIW
jgi:type IX secretion system PorP/SprF family membrane protein